MSLFDVLSGRQSFGSWFTGRSEKESDVYANPEKASLVVDTLNGIATDKVGAAQGEIYAAINRLNSVNGLLENVGGIDLNFYDSIFTSIEETIQNLAVQMENKIEDIKIYEESNVFEKIGSTLAMGIFKVSEGVLSVAEDLGDGVCAVVGWGAGLVGAKDFQQDCANFDQKEWSHDVFNFYYDSDFAKKSAITEDSGAAGTLKIVGKTVGYLYAGGVVTGLTGFSGATNVGVGVLKASGTTWGATMAAGIGGLGSGTEAGLNAGLDYNSAVSMGVKEGGIQAGLAFVGGKVGEGLQKRAAVKSGSASSDAKWSDFQGYSDSITQAGERFGVAERNMITSTGSLVGAEARNLTSGIRGLNPVEKRLAEDAVSAAKDTFKDSASTLLRENPISQGVTALKSTVSSATSIPGAIRSAGSSVVSSVQSEGVLATLKNGGSAAIQGARNVVSSAAFPGVAATLAGSTFNEYVSENGEAFRDSLATKELVDPEHTTPFVKAESLVLDNNSSEDEFVVDPPISDTPVASPSSYDNSGYGNSSEGNSSIGNVGGYQYRVDAESSDTSSSNPSGDNSPVLPTGNSNGEDTFQPLNPSNSNDSNSFHNTDGSQIPSSGDDVISPVDSTPSPSSNTGVSDSGDNSLGVTPIPISSSTPSGDSSSHSVTFVDGTPGEYHSGGGYDGSSLTTDSLVLENADDLELLDELEESATSLDDIISGGSYQKIPTSSIPVSTKKNGSSVIPIAAGLSAAAAAGIGAKAYMDYKKNNEMNEEEEFDEEYSDEYQEDDLDVHEWNDDSVDDSDSDNSGNSENFDEYLEEEPSYSARNNNELLEIE